MLDSLAPDGALQTFFAGRVVRAAWRLERAERIEAELFARQMQGVFGDEDDLGLALIRDGNGARAFDTLLRYRASAQAEVFRTLRTLKALQAEAAQVAMPARRARAQREADLPDPAADPSPELPKEPKAGGNSGESNVHAASAGASPVTDAAASLPASAPARDAAPDGRTDAPSRRAPASPETPIEPKGRDNPGRVAPVPAAPERQAPMPCIGAPAVRQAG